MQKFKLIFIAFFLLLFFCSCEFTSTKETADYVTLNQVEKELRESRKPDLSELWKKLLISKDEKKYLPKFEKKDLNQKSWFELAGCSITAGKDEILKILKVLGSSGHAFFFVFKKLDSDWVYLDGISSFDKYEEVEIQFTGIGDDAILLYVTKYITGGKGIYRSNAIFNRYMNGKMKPVLEVLKKGRLINWGWMFEREFNSEIELIRDEKTDEIKITYDIKYFNSPKKGYPDKRVYSKMPLFTAKKSVYFIWDANNKKYRIDSYRSELNEDQIVEIFIGGNKELYKQYKKEIDDLIENGNDYQKEWAKLFIKEAGKN